MDVEKLLTIKTFSQEFSNSPNEKFLLMILCSQAKLENDNRGLNVKRGISAKCEMGWRPCMPPLGYYNRALNNIKDIIIDPERGPIIKEMYYRTVYLGYSGRKIKKWLDSINFTSKSGNLVPLSHVLKIIKNPFYYGEFEYPIDSGKWYKGSHEPLITKEIFDMVQSRRLGPRKSQYGAKFFAYKGILKCGNCAHNITAEEKFRKLLDGEFRHHIYYHCARSLDNGCGGYICEEELEEKLLEFIENIDLSKTVISQGLRIAFGEYKKVTFNIFAQQGIGINNNDINLKSYARYVFKEGTSRQKAEFVRGFGTPLYLYNKGIYVEQFKGNKTYF